VTTTIRILSRASDLARLQALLVGRALAARWPDIEVVYLTRSAAGDRDAVTPLASLADKGAFTADLSDALTTGEADAVVHSWKDLPLEGRADTAIVATLERADPRDVLVVRRDVAERRPESLAVLSSSPRRAWLLQQALPALLPWPAVDLRLTPVRGNIPTRLRKLRDGEGDALVMAKAALDRLLGFGAPFEEVARTIRQILDDCRWMVLPLRDVPGAPAQGALAVEMRRDSPLVDRVASICHEPTWSAIVKERDVLADWGGGCHEALGVTVLSREYGQVTSIRGRSDTGRLAETWSLGRTPQDRARVPLAKIWPRPEERHHGTRRSLDVAPPAGDGGYWIARADALPGAWTVSPARMVWAAGTTTWRRLAARGIWVHGCADGLGDQEPPAIDLLAGRVVKWHRLTHRAAEPGPDTLATYEVSERLPDDLARRTHFFWTSGALFLEAVARWPEIRDRWHASGPGRTSRVLQDAIGSNGRTGVWLDYDDWRHDILETQEINT
jgi:hydroxymethylbilane synthase